MVAGYALLLIFPQPLFAHSRAYHRLKAYSDQPLPPETEQLLERVEKRLARSPLFAPDRDYSVFLCQSRWRFALFANLNWRVGGVLPPIGRNVFLRPCRIKEDRLLSPSGTEVGGDRTLTYFVAHELTHTLTADALGRLDYFLLPVWVREGYADFIAKEAFDLERARADRDAGDRRMDPKLSGLYDLYHLRVRESFERGESLPALLGQRAR